MTPDVNVLVAASRTDHPQHVQALAWLRGALAASSGGARLEILPMVASGYLRVVTHPKVFAQPTPIDAAVAFLDAILATPGVLMPPVGREWSDAAAPVPRRRLERQSHPRCLDRSGGAHARQPSRELRSRLRQTAFDPRIDASADRRMNDKNNTPPAFIARWQGVGGSERANYQLFVTELCRLLDVPEPGPARDDTRDNAYVFERRITFAHGDGSSSAGFIDCYKRGAFVLEAKRIKAGAHTQGFDDALLRARAQAEGYARALPAAEGRPPFLLVVDVGHVIELYAEFTRSGATYTPFPDPRSHRIRLADLHDEAVRQRLRTLWLEPMALDPTRISAKVTRDVAVQLAALARSLEGAGHSAEQTAAFLTRCLFSMFAEDVGLLPKADDGQGAFVGLLKRHRDDAATLQKMLAVLWADMDRGGFSAALAQDVLRFNGKLFKGWQAARLRAAAEPRADRRLLLASQRQLARGGAGHLRHAAGTRARPRRAPRAGRALHAARLCRAAGAAHRGRAAARRLGQRPGRGAAAGQRGQRAGRQEARGQAGRGARRDAALPPPAVHGARARPGLRQRQLPVRDAGTPEAAGRRSAGPARRAGRHAGPGWGWKARR